jgi:hypothetical protein
MKVLSELLREEFPTRGEVSQPTFSWLCCSIGALVTHFHIFFATSFPMLVSICGFSWSSLRADEYAWLYLGNRWSRWALRYSREPTVAMRASSRFFGIIFSILQRVSLYPWIVAIIERWLTFRDWSIQSARWLSWVSDVSLEAITHLQCDQLTEISSFQISRISLLICGFGWTWTHVFLRNLVSIKSFSNEKSAIRHSFLGQCSLVSKMTFPLIWGETVNEMETFADVQCQGRHFWFSCSHPEDVEIILVPKLPGPRFMAFHQFCLFLRFKRHLRTKH